MMVEFPRNLEVERSVIGGMLLDATTIDDVAEILTPDDFWSDTHKLLCRRVFSLRADGRSIDAVVLAEALRADGSLEKVGGELEVLGFVQAVPHAACTLEHAQITVEYAIRRDLIVQALQTISEASSVSVEAERAVDSAESRIFALSDSRTRHVATLAADAVPAAVDRVLERETHGETGLGTSLLDLDDMLGGLSPEQLVIVGARPSMGKTAFALLLAEAVIELANKPVLFVSLEMSSAAIGDRLLTMRSRVSGSKIQTGRCLGDEDRASLAAAAGEFRRLAPLVIDDTPIRTSTQILAHARRVKSRYGLGCVIVDYIQLVEPENPKEGRQEQIARIVRRLKQTARELGVPVIALSQLNRAVESREDRRPRMADLRESGAIEQDADAVLLLHRPEYYDPNDSPGLAEVIVAKNRNGATGTVKVTYLKAITRFESLAENPF